MRLLVALGHRVLQAGQLGLELERLLARAEHVVAQGEVALARRALVVQRHARVLASTSSPPSIEVSPASIRSSVVLPAPLRPAIVTRSRRSSFNETPRRSGSPAMSLDRSDAIRTATDLHGRFAAVPHASRRSRRDLRRRVARRPGPAKTDHVTVSPDRPGLGEDGAAAHARLPGRRGDFTLIGRDIVKRVPGLQVWALDRRSQRAGGHLAASATRSPGGSSPQQTFDYYAGWIGDPRSSRTSSP